MNDGLDIGDVCSNIRARIHEALENRDKGKECALSHDDVVDDIFALRSAYLRVENDVELKRNELMNACKQLDALQMRVKALQVMADGLNNYLQNLPSLGKEIIDTLVPESEFLAKNPDVVVPDESAPPEQHSEYLRKRLEYDMNERKRLLTEREDMSERKRKCLEVMNNGERFLESLEGFTVNMKKQLPSLCSSLILPESLLPEPASKIPGLAWLRSVLQGACSVLNNGATITAKTHGIEGYTSVFPKVGDDMFASRCCIVLTLPIGKGENRELSFSYVRSTTGLSFITVQPTGARNACQSAILDNLLTSGKNRKALNAVVARFMKSDNTNAGTKEIKDIPFATAYAWAQKLDEKGKTEELQQHAIHCLAALKERYVNLLELERYLSQLNEGVIPSPHSGSIDLRSAVTLSKWSEVPSPSPDILSALHLDPFPVSFSEPYSGVSYRFFCSLFTVGSVSLTAYFCVSSSYPQVPPRVWLDTPRCDTKSLRLLPFYSSMERSVVTTVNTFGLTPTTTVACNSGLIVTQIRYLQFALNVLLCEGTDMNQKIECAHPPCQLLCGREHIIVFPSSLPLVFF